MTAIKRLAIKVSEHVSDLLHSGRNLKCSNHCTENSLVVFEKAMRPTSAKGPLFVYPREMKAHGQVKICTQALRDALFGNQKLGAIQMFIHRQMDKQLAVHSYNGKY